MYTIFAIFAIAFFAVFAQAVPTLVESGSINVNDTKSSLDALPYHRPDFIETEPCNHERGGQVSPGVECYCQGENGFNDFIDDAIDKACVSWDGSTLGLGEELMYVKRREPRKPVYLWMINYCALDRRQVFIDANKCKEAMHVITKQCQWPYWLQKGGHVTMNYNYEVGGGPDRCLMARLDVQKV